MIQFRPENLENNRETELRNWLNKPEFNILVSVIEARLIKYEVASLEKAMQSKQFPNYTDAANGELGAAIRCREFLEVLNQIKTQKEPFEIVKPSTSKI